MRGATDQYKPCVYLENISIHTPHAGSDAAQPDSSSSVDIFQSTLPMRGATTRICDIRRVSRFQSTLPMRRATRPGRVEPNVSFISIHTPHAGSDARRAVKTVYNKISIHTPHAGSDYLGSEHQFGAGRFQSTLPMRGATARDQLAEHNLRQFQSTLPMRGATTKVYTFPACMTISIHTPHAGSDLGIRFGHPRWSISIHTPHAGSDTGQPVHFYLSCISIHTPHAGSDAPRWFR